MTKKQIIKKLLLSILVIITICLIKQNSYAKYDITKNVNAVKVYIDYDPPEVKLQFQEEGQRTMVVITANEEIKEVEGWELKEDRKTLTKEIIGRLYEEIIIEDLYSNITYVELNF